MTTGQAKPSRVQLLGKYKPANSNVELFVHAASNDVSEGLLISPESREFTGAAYRLAKARQGWVGSPDTLITEVANADYGWDFYIVSQAAPRDRERKIGQALGLVSVRRADQSEDGKALRIARMLFDHKVVAGHDAADSDAVKDAMYMNVVGALLRTVLQDRPNVEDIIVADSDVSQRGEVLLPRLGVTVTRTEQGLDSVGLEGGRQDILRLTAFLGSNLLERVVEPA